jgi:hypothetical protein
MSVGSPGYLILAKSCWNLGSSTQTFDDDADVEWHSIEVASWLTVANSHLSALSIIHRKQSKFLDFRMKCSHFIRFFLAIIVD